MSRFSLHIVLLVLISALSANSGFTQNYGLSWAKSVGGPLNEYAYSTDVDDAGNMYFVGVFQDSADFDPGNGKYILYANAVYDMFILKLDKYGDLKWVKSMGANLGFGSSIRVDESQNVYITGRYSGTVDFDPNLTNTYNLTSAGGNDIFILKLNADGNFEWVKSFGGTSTDFGYSIDLDVSGNIYTTGFFGNTVDFDPDTLNTFNLIAGGSIDAFILKLDTGGNLVWAKQINGSGSSISAGTCIRVGATGNIHVAGEFEDTVDLNPGPAVANHISNGNRDIFLIKLDTNGNLVWVKSFGSTVNDDYVKNMTLDALGDIYTTGSFYGTVDFDPGPGTDSRSSVNGSPDIYLQKFTTSGSHEWVMTAGGSGQDMGRAVAIDDSGYVYTTGSFTDSVDFDPGPNKWYLKAKGAYDCFIQKIDPNGTFIWALNFGGNAASTAGGFIRVDSWGNNIYTSGSFSVSVDFDPSPDTFELRSYAWNQFSDVFIQKLTRCSTDSTDEIVFACDSFVWIDGKTYRESNNTATHLLFNEYNCDSIISLKLTIGNDSTIDRISTCSTLTWIDGKTYTEDNDTAIFIYTNAVGCDSVIRLDLKILQNSAVDIISACDSMVWIDGKTYYQDNNTASHVLTNSLGCDSVVHLDLTIHNISAKASANGMKLTANVQGGLYRWLDCNDNYSFIAQATNRTFTAKKNGSYAVQIRKNGCTDTSECVTIDYVGIEQSNAFSQISIFPNPSNGLVNIDFGELKDVSLKVYNSMDQLIHQKDNIQTGQYQFEVNGSNGVYFVELSDGIHRNRYRLVISNP